MRSGSSRCSGPVARYSSRLGGLGLILVCADDLRVSGASCLTGEGVTTPRGVAHDFASRQSDRTHR